MPRKMTNATYQKKRIAASKDSLIAQLAAILKPYIKREGCPMDCALRDVLTDVRHLCDVHGLDFGDIDARAYDGYLEELSYRDDPNDWKYVKGQYVGAAK